MSVKLDRATVVRVLRRAGIDVYAIRRRQQARRIYRANKDEYERQSGASKSGRDFPFGHDYPCLADRFANAGEATGHYFHQDLLVAQWVREAQPVRHIDVGSRVDGFVAHVAAFRPIEVVDIRPLTTSWEQIVFHQRDVTKDDPAWDSSCDSLSCLHAVEHFGLGRYGDPVDVDGWLHGWENLTRMVKPGGVFYFSTPIGPQRVEFDAHRVFAVPFLVALIERDFDVERLFYVDDGGDLHGPVDPHGADAARSFGCTYGCGIFALRRRSTPREETRP